MVRTKSSDALLERLQSALIAGLKTGGISAEVDIEPVEMTKLHRVTVLAPKFKKMMHSERQDLVWRIAEQVLTPEEQLLISMILTLTPAEAEGRWS
jgi:hypothetical protein